MKISNINSNYNLANQNVNFMSTKKGAAIPQSVIEHLGINIETMVGYSGKRTIAPVPETVDKKIANFLRKLQIDWNTHVNPAAENKAPY